MSQNCSAVRHPAQRSALISPAPRAGDTHAPDTHAPAYRFRARLRATHPPIGQAARAPP
ncbi:unnamed protein product [Mycetohabitans rhizoxinica HKI 454]|uniref:Uncharacterized protein n=1 Tax=Mycetohabitans rhizoxinica (strain DSM 19002 / CIP 109453 / HKI 454) TaxID=882378 RepID=E5AMX2_MYCRK|nr:unnamed protein product [Mycetohabitans rhizoxinica HKI 454]